MVMDIQRGVILGPSILGRSANFSATIFPLRSIMVLETLANVGLLFFLFLVGVEMDLGMIRKTSQKAMVIAIASFSVLARILAELKLLNTEIGKIAMSAAMINDICAWILLALVVALVESNSSTTLAPFYVIFSSIGFVLMLIFVVRPDIEWFIHRIPNGESFSDYHICLILTGVFVCGFITDAIGTHSIFGAFGFGLIIPKGPLATTLFEKLEDFVTTLLLPLYFSISELRTDISSVNGKGDYGFFIAIIVLACVGKVVGTLLIALYYKMPFREAFVLALLMNTKGLTEMVVLNVGKDQKVLDDQLFAIMVVVAVLVAGMITPTVVAIYKPARGFITHKRRTIQRSTRSAELRVLTCIHTTRNVPSVINLLEISNPTKKLHIAVYVLQLVELTGRASAMLIVHNTHRVRKPAIYKTQVQSEQIINSFKNLQQHVTGLSIHPLTAISPYSTMHEDICHLAEDERVTFIILPFHKQQAVDGDMEATNPVLRNINQNVGLGGLTRVVVSQISHNIAVLFFGGPDDREALSYAWRIARHPGVSLAVFKFLPGEDVVRPKRNYDNFTNGRSNLNIVTETETERLYDDKYITDFRLQNVSDETIVYTEKFINNAEEIVAAVRSMENINDLHIVGRGQGMISLLIAGLND
ncbi:hypothetical protein GIB67_001509 [Kingdonia uniflora]|uniref:Cation/H+ exchanger domain-containing protein n=1 Tax=Kingdonia uniflora TaxID=39325 RepID=A0A7J7L4U8_9MAGN|nr:hypothetical protein GIB67_001509 [Kingdonia uniflora]